MKPVAEIIQFEKKQEAKFSCSACGADRGCNCNAPAVEKLREKMEQDRQRAKRAYEKKKNEQNQQPSHVRTDSADRAEARCATEWKEFTAQEERNAVDSILEAIHDLTDEQRALLFQTLKDSYQWTM